MAAQADTILEPGTKVCIEGRRGKFTIKRHAITKSGKRGYWVITPYGDHAAFEESRVVTGTRR